MDDSALNLPVLHLDEDRIIDRLLRELREEKRVNAVLENHISFLRDSRNFWHDLATNRISQSSG